MAKADITRAHVRVEHLRVSRAVNGLGKGEDGYGVWIGSQHVGTFLGENGFEQAERFASALTADHIRLLAKAR